MATLLDLFPARVAIGSYTDANGRRVPVLASQEFLRALQLVFDRIGGAVGPSITDLANAGDEDSGLEEFKSEQAKANDAFDMLPPVVFLPQDDPLHPLPQEHPAYQDPLHPLPQEHRAYEDPMHPLAQMHVVAEALQTELNGLREEVAVLRDLINGIQQGTAL